MQVIEFIEQANAATSAADVLSLFGHVIGAFGYERFAIVPLTPAAQAVVGVNNPTPFLGSNIPEDWVTHYVGNRYYETDPVILAGAVANRPVIWADCFSQNTLSLKQQRIYQESREAQLHEGISIPLHGPNGESFLMSLAAAGPQDPPPCTVQYLHLCAVQFWVSYRALLGDGSRVEACRVGITDRERECLTWTARGKSAWEISVILHVSEHTVNFHLKSAIRKLAAANKVQAVTNAIRSGLILP